MASDSYIVVARYKEDISYLAPIADRIVLYNKGETRVPGRWIDYHKLPNVGRESDSYLRHIIYHYDNLPSIICFTQANIEDHLGANEPNKLLALIEQAEEHGYSQNFSLVSPSSVKDWQISYWKGKLDRVGKPFGEWFEETFETPYPEAHWPVWWGVCFALRSEYIRKRPKAFYEKLWAQCQTLNPEVTHFFERSYAHIFSVV
jgi:hypothetical protein